MSPEQSTREAERRRLQDTMIVIGTGIIAFGAWSLMKTILVFVFETEQMAALIDRNTPAMTSYIGLGIATFTDLGLRLYVGGSARAEGLGHRKGYGYLVFVVLLAIGHILAIAISAVAMYVFEISIFDTVVALTIEGTSLALLIMLLVSSVRLKRLARLEA